jgi:hypothetical protein
METTENTAGVSATPTTTACGKYAIFKMNVDSSLNS